MNAPDTDVADGGLDDWRAQLRARGLRLTPQRELILGAVEQLRHATPDQVHARVRETSEAINLSTVYRTLEVLEDLGLVRHAHLADRAPTYHAVTGDPHFHLVCRNCGRTQSVAPETVAPLQRALHEQEGFEMDVGHLTVFGWCTTCPSDHEEHTHD
ncbi:Fur family transcriptional regulator [Nocardioides sp. R-C-SC26]|uniref:Fur family transcriptional regulator n=1 Tax=Nocardioides sp. R-C-SC26 TaxID=2870414 RepID=UPI001E51EB22|nr:Fur family transcriptional regulator [Nocardioides sp. R-C-SC26]